jgi:hypothetical protein
MAEEDILPFNTNDQEAFLSSNIEDYLLSLAESLQQVQRELNQTTISGAEGSPTVRYQLPKLEFELKMSLEMTQSSEGSTHGTLLARPINATNSASRSQAAETASTIKGMFVAVPIDGGKPPVVIGTQIYHVPISPDNDNPNLWKVTVEVQSAVGQRLEGIEVHFNIDRPESIKLSEANGVIIAELSRETDVKHGLMLTDNNGVVVNTLEARPTEEEGAYIVLLIDVLGRSESLVFRIGEKDDLPAGNINAIITQLNSWSPDKETLFGLLTPEDTLSAFKQALSPDFLAQIENSPDQDLMKAQLEEEVQEKHQDFISKLSNLLTMELSNWQPALSSSFDDAEAMKNTFISSAKDSIKALVGREDIWERDVIKVRFQKRFDDFRNLQAEELIVNLSSWSFTAGKSYLNIEEIRDDFISNLVDDSTVKAIASQDSLWKQESLQKKLVDLFYQSIVEEAIVEIDQWVVTAIQRESINDLVSIQNVFYSRHAATFIKKVKELQTMHGRSIKSEADIVEAFRQKLIKLISPDTEKL